MLDLRHDNVTISDGNRFPDCLAVVGGIDCLREPNDSLLKCKYAMFSDSLSVLPSIKEGICKSRPSLFNELSDLLNRLIPNKVKFTWIPSHIDINGNERADRLAKEALEIEDVNSTEYLEIDEINTLSKP